MTPKQVLIKAAKVISEKGWTTGVMSESDGRVCMVGAISVASTPKNPYALADRSLVRGAEELLYRYTTRLYGVGCGHISSVNDRKLNSGVEASCMLLEAAEYKP